MEPISTFVEFGEREFLVTDERGYEFLLYKMAETFLFTSEGKILDDRLKLNKVSFISNKIMFFYFIYMCVFNHKIFFRKKNIYLYHIPIRII